MSIIKEQLVNVWQSQILKNNYDWTQIYSNFIFTYDFDNFYHFKYIHFNSSFIDNI